MSRFGFLLGALLVAPFLTSCDPGGYLTLQVHNKTDQTVRVTVPRVYMYQNQVTPVEAREPAVEKEVTMIDVRLEPGEAKEAKGGIAAGDRVGPARAYIGDRLVFCEEYHGNTPYLSGETWRVEVVEGPLSCGTPTSQ